MKKNKLNSQLLDKLQELKSRIPKVFSEKDNTFVVGGSIRNLIMGRPLKDIDILIVGERVEEFFKKHRFPGSKIVPLKKDFDEFRLIPENGLWIDISSTFKTLREDLKSRDFTINSMAIRLHDLNFHDPFKGLVDLENKILRTTRLKNLQRDPVRVLRAFRFVSQFDLNIEEKTRKWIKKAASLVGKSAPERIRYELVELFQGNNFYRALREMTETGIIFQVIPELRKLERTTQIYHSEQNLWEHTLLLMKNLEEYLNDLDNSPLNFLKEEIAKVLEKDQNKSVLCLASIFHDIGKPDTRTVDPITKRTHFIGHEKIGTQITREVLKKLRFSNEEIRKITTLVRYHMYPHHLAWDEYMTKRAIARYYNKLGEWAIPLLLLSCADAMASPPELVGISRHIFLGKRILELIQELRKGKPKRIITGYDLIDLGLNPGPLFRRILETVNEEYMAGLINTKEEALKRALEVVKESQSGD